TPALTLPHGDFAGREAFEDVLDGELRAAGAELVVLAGFMRVLGPDFVDRWRDRSVNIHPSLLPAFRGLDTHRRALEAGVRWHGCTVHFVRAELDAGPIILQAAVPVRPDDTEETLAARVLAREHDVLPMAVGWIAEGRVRVENERVVAVDPDRSPVNPSQ
ncbi:MAG: phosphoribosylglycinamide formyltransferase, partial [Alphaproteobacteria bacterium]|nr:phosphoribosylglycinamide formyltransferase [Alphaproteobacteria bacterium]